jgi:hypothetical protein
VITCYEVAAPIDPIPPTGEPGSARGRLRLCWQSFPDLARRSAQEWQGGAESDLFHQQLTSAHRLAMDELVAAGELPAPVADLVQEAYEAAVYHVWRSSVGLTCYMGVTTYYGPASAEALIQQAEALAEIGAEGAIDPDTISQAKAAIEHDLAYHAMGEEEVEALYHSLAEGGGDFPAFEGLTLEITPEAEAAAAFIIELLTEP